MTSFRRFGMLSISFRQYSGVISLTQTSFIAFSNSLALLACFSATLFLTTIHRFSIGFKSGLLPGQSRTLTFFDFKKVVTILERWHGAPSCMKISQLWTVMWSSSFSSNSWRYLWPFMATPFGRKNNPAVPFTLFVKSLPWRSTNEELARVELLQCGFVRKQYFFPLLNCPAHMFFGKCQSVAC